MDFKKELFLVASLLAIAFLGFVASLLAILFAVFLAIAALGFVANLLAILFAVLLAIFLVLLFTAFGLCLLAAFFLLGFLSVHADAENCHCGKHH